ncbi:hypothetical protein MKK50_14270 [Methylobacterium sp. J-043]|nr:hypothetical protein [Methylobacterium sp. J-043]
MSIISELVNVGWEPNASQWKGPTIDTRDDYDLAVIEFDDQGWYQKSNAQNELAKYLEKSREKKLTIIAFIHGWRHNAAETDENLKAFRELLQDAVDIEGYAKPDRRVFGVYLAWRGLSLRGIASYGTFWTRKDAAFRVAVGSVREVLASLRRHQRDYNKPLTEDAVESGDGTRLVLAGHSFGGLILFSAVAEFLIDSVVRPKKKVVRPFGDLVILVNPAFEATRFQPLATAIRSRGDFPAGQRVCFMAVTAENDEATRIAFPLGRWCGSRFEAIRREVYPEVPPDAQQVLYPKLPPDAQREANLRTVGHLPWLTTHELTAPTGTNAKLLKAIERGWRPSTAEEDAAFDAFNKSCRTNGALPIGWRRDYTSGASLRHVAGHPDNPFWVVRASREVIDGHNGIFRPIFLNFLRQLCDDRVRRKLPDTHWPDI